jgi:hypothetical protein
MGTKEYAHRLIQRPTWGIYLTNWCWAGARGLILRTLFSFRGRRIYLSRVDPDYDWGE